MNKNQFSCVVGHGNEAVIIKTMLPRTSAQEEEEEEAVAEPKPPANFDPSRRFV